MQPEKILKAWFGYDSFRPGQREVVDTILSGRDCLAILPTGAGKSVCFQVPALMQTCRRTTYRLSVSTAV